MSYHHFTILFVIIFAVISMKIQVMISKYELAADNYVQIERSFFVAADTAGKALCRYGTSGIITDKGAAFDYFLYSMYASLGIMDNPAKREELLNYIPMFAVLAEEGFYIRFEDEYEKEDGFHYVTRNWTECMPYSYSDEDFTYCFTLDGIITIFDKNGLIDGTVRFYQATQSELVEDKLYRMLRILRPDSFLLDEESFKIVKQTAVITSIQNAMRYYISNHNRIADKYGIVYEFALPVIDNSIWNRSIEYPGVFIMIQGYPVDVTHGIFYNQYAFVGAQIYKQKPYFLTEQEWYFTYHKEGCEKLVYGGEDVYLYPYYSVEDCVKRGAYACESCISKGVYPPEIIYSVNEFDKANGNAA